MPILTGGGGGGGAAGSSGMTFISTTVLGAPAAALTVSSIPSTFTDLYVVYGKLQSTRVALSDGLLVRVNSDAGASHYGAGAGGGGAGGFGTSFTLLTSATGAGITQGGGGWILITNYNDAVNQIAFMGQNGGRIGNSGVAGDFNQPTDWNGIWNNGAGINRVDLLPGTGPNWNAGGFLTVYGLT